MSSDTQQPSLAADPMSVNLNALDNIKRMAACPPPSEWPTVLRQKDELIAALRQQKYINVLKAHPNVTVDLSPGASSTDQLLQKLSAGFAGGQYPDMSYAFGSWAGQLEASGRTLDISSEVKKPEVKWDEFTAAARGTAQPTGTKVIGFPAAREWLLQ